MARYIDLDLLLELINDDCKYSIATNDYQRGCNDVCDWAINIIKNILTSDVVPRSEVEQAKQEVARQIFAEIEEIINSPHTVGFSLLAPLRQAINEYSDGIKKELLYYVAELKEKYVGE